MNLSGTVLIAWSIGLMLAGGVLATDDSPTRHAPAPALTTDTREYCNTLRDRVVAAIHGSRLPPPTEVIDLSNQGGQMCDQGQPRGGVLRLRRALMLLHQHQAAP